MKLQTHEAIALYGLDLNHYRHIISAINKIHSQSDLYSTIQTCCDVISEVIGVIGAGIYIQVDNHLQLKAMSKSWYDTAKLGDVGIQIDKIKALQIDLTQAEPNLPAQAALNRQFISSDSLYECIKPMGNKAICDLIQRAVGVDKIAYMAIVGSDQQLIGVMGFAVRKSDILDEILPVVLGLIDAAASALERQLKLTTHISTLLKPGSNL